MKPFFGLIRYKNLLIVGILQYLLRYCLILPYTKKYGAVLLLDEFNFFLLVLSTILVAAGGYIINDIVDYPIDIINKPEKTFINRSISAENAFRFYQLLSILGGILALLVAFATNKIIWWALYPIAIILLYLYAVSLKKSPLFGNLIVAGFTSAVSIITILPLPKIPLCGLQILLFGYAWFAFWSNLARELIKDAEDIEGDSQNGCHTVPILWGLRLTKKIVGFCIFILTVSLICFTVWLLETQILCGVVYIVSFLILPFVGSFVLLYNATEKEDFYTLSQLLKILMVIGLLFLPFFYCLNFGDDMGLF